MRKLSSVMTLLTTALAAMAPAAAAQSGTAQPVWETLMRAPLPEHTLPKLSVFSLPAIPPAPPVPSEPGAGHTHAGPVFGYILQGTIENLVEPDPPVISQAGEVFYETPLHLHRYLRNVSKTEPARVLIFQAGDTGNRAPAIKLLIEVPLLTPANQEVSLLRLTLPAGTKSDAGALSDPGIMYVIKGKIEAGGKLYGPGDVFLRPPSLKNASAGEPAKLLLYQASEPSPAPRPAIATKIVMQEPLGDTSDPKMSLFVLNLSAGLTVPSHTHAGAVFAYILQGDIENQVEPDPPNIYHPADFFHERPMQVHRLLRNLSQTEPAKLIIFQSTGALSPGITPLIQEPLANIANQQVSMITLVAAPGAEIPGAHQHPGPVFAYVLKGEIESQVDPDPPKVYRAGDVFYEPPMHAHRLFRNLSKTEPADLLIFQVSEKGRPLAMGAN